MTVAHAATADLEAAFTDIARPPSFVDLRAFAAQAEARLRAQPGQYEGDAFLGNRAALVSSGAEGPVHFILLPAGSGAVAEMPGDEFVLVLSGALTLTAQSGEYLLGPNDAAVIPHGSDFGWTAGKDTAVIAMRYAKSETAGRAITPISKDPAFAPSGKPAPEVLIGPAPECCNFNDYRVDEGRFVCGTWNSTPYRRTAILYGHHEIMLLGQGAVTFTDDAGRSGTFREGDVILVEAGARCAWDSRTDVTKVFAIYRV